MGHRKRKIPPKSGERQPGRIFTIFAMRSKTKFTPEPDDWVHPNLDAAAPALWEKRVPESEKGAASHVAHLLFMLNYYVRCFESDVQLYEAAAGFHFPAHDTFEKFPEGSQDPEAINANKWLEITDGWATISARDGAMSIYHFGRTIEGFYDTWSNAPYLRENFGRAVKNADKALRIAFPNFINARDAVSHSGGRGRNPSQQDIHAYLGPWANSQMSIRGNDTEILLVDNMSNRQYSNTWEGKVISYEISLQSALKLAAIRDEIFNAFASVDKQT